MESGTTEEKSDEQYAKAIENKLHECQLQLKGYATLLSRSFKAVGVESKEGDKSATEQEVLRVLQYNILADALATEGGTFDKVPKGCLEWAFRKHRILEQILHLNPDVICLEEVDHFSDFFEPVFNDMGYTGAFFPKKDSPCLRCDGNNGPDGLAIFFRRSKLSLLEIENKYLGNLEKGESNQPITMCLLRSKKAGKNVCFAVTHFKAKKGFENLRAAQAKSCLKVIDQFRKKVDYESAIIICGDFNGVPFEDFYQIIAGDPQSHLVSAYLKAVGDEPPYTTWKIRQDIETKHSIDYIWFSQELLDVVSYLQLPDDQEIPETRFPSYSSPSDHLALCCDFVFKD